MYSPQTEDLKHVMYDIIDFDTLLESGIFGDLSKDLVDAILNEAGKLAGDVIAPLNRVGDQQPAQFDPETGKVTTSPGWIDAYRQWIEGGWSSLPCDPEYDGQGLPMVIALCAMELWSSAACSFGLGALLTQGAVNALGAHGSDELKQKYLPKMISGVWTGTMCLTEPQAGTDLGALRTKAEPNDDGSYNIFGTKIFITYGEQDMTENIIHLVLARIEGAPEGHRGISLFVVPKILVNEDGSLGEANDVKCVGIEHKLGIHGSPTATMQWGDNGGAKGWLVGEPNRGLTNMFTMMNDARLHVGAQGVAIAERAYQLALSYANERKQGSKPGHEGSVAIIEHSDVRRMLLEMKSKIAAARAICFEVAKAMDIERSSDDEATRQQNAALAALLTPVAKAFGTDIGSEVASLGIQVHGGMGFIEETGAAQHLRDVRITQIYEGTNGIQALDLVTRKLPLANGDLIKGWISHQKQIAAGLDDDLSEIAAQLNTSIAQFEKATAVELQRLAARDEQATAAAVSYLRAMGLIAGTAAMARGAQKSGDGKRKQLAKYFAANHLPHVSGLVEIVINGAGQIIDRTDDPLAV